VSSRRAVLAGGLVAVIAGVGLGIAVMPAFGQSPTADQIVRRVADQAKATTSVHATVSVATDDGKIGGPIVAEVWSEEPGRGRAEVRQSPLTELNGMVAVSDGETGAFYNKAKNQVIVASKGDFDAMKPANVPRQALDFNRAIDELFKNADVKLLGNETIDGVATYKLEATPKPGTEAAQHGAGKATVWIDQSRNIPLKAVISAKDGVFTISAKNVELNPKLDPALWKFTIPAGAEVIKAADLKPQPLTVDQARSLSSIKVLIPETLPAGWARASIERVSQSVVQKYENGKLGFIVWAGPEAQAPRPAGRDAEKVTVRGIEGSLRSADGQTSLLWRENGVAYVIAGDLSREDALKLAATLK
jgi:outer membrane lipoprotein-sorting protein